LAHSNSRELLGNVDCRQLARLSRCAAASVPYQQTLRPFPGVNILWAGWIAIVFADSAFLSRPITAVFY
jgi:hypothetical protein